MQYLLDTHTFIWFINGDASLPDKLKKEIVNRENRCFLSIASLWEIAIKLKIGKLNLSSSFDAIAQLMANEDIEILPIDFAHLQTLLSPDMSHRDPFDRIILSQAIAENLTLISKDTHFPNYPVSRLWN